jgi:hypothetical protein
VRNVVSAWSSGSLPTLVWWVRRTRQVDGCSEGEPARPKVTDYPFHHTLTSVVGHNDGEFVMADVPGLISGAHQERGW